MHPSEKATTHVLAEPPAAGDTACQVCAGDAIPAQKCSIDEFGLNRPRIDAPDPNFALVPDLFTMC